MRNLLLVVVAALALVPGSAAAASTPSPLGGVVVGAQHGTLLVASSQGLVRVVAGHARTGSRVSVANGRLTVLGHVRSTLVRGVVIRRHAGLTFLSASNHVLVLRGAARRLASVSDTQPAPGSIVQSTVTIDDQGNLAEENEHALGQASNTEVQAVVSAVAPGSITLTVNGQPLTIPLPAGLTLPATLVGATLTLKLDFNGGTATVGGTTSGDDQGDDGEDDDNVTTGTGAINPATSVTVTVQGGHSGGDGHHGGGGGDD